MPIVSSSAIHSNKIVTIRPLLTSNLLKNFKISHLSYNITMWIQQLFALLSFEKSFKSHSILWMNRVQKCHWYSLDYKSIISIHLQNMSQIVLPTTSIKHSLYNAKIVYKIMKLKRNFSKSCLNIFFSFSFFYSHDSNIEFSIRRKRRKASWSIMI